MRTVLGANLSPFVRKVRVFLAEKGLEYQLEPVVPFNPGPEFKAISPLGKIPAYRDGDVTLADSSVICAYLEKSHPQPALYPAEPLAYARALWFEEFGDSGLAPIMGAKIFFQRLIGPAFFGQQPDQAVIEKALTSELPPLFDYLEAQLGDRAYVVGNTLSIGDIGLCTQFANFQHAGERVDATRWPRLARYVAAILSRPSFAALITEEAAALGARGK